MTTIIGSAVLLGFSVTALLMLLLRPVAFKLGFLDSPGGRKHHVGHIPTTGGPALFLGISAAIFIFQSSDAASMTYLVAGGLIVLVGLIDDRLRVEIQASDFIIADLTHDNLGAYWEAGYAEGLGKPVIYTCGKTKFEKEKTHFDTNHHLTIVWDSDNPQQAGEDLKATVRATLPQLAKQED